MSDITEDIGSYLEDATLSPSLVMGTNVFGGVEPETPDQSVTVYEYASAPPAETQGENALPVWTMPRVQVRVRGAQVQATPTSYEDTRTWAEAIWRALCIICNETVNGVYYLRLQPIDNPAFLMWDGNYRPIFVMNFQAFRGVS